MSETIEAATPTKPRAKPGRGLCFEYAVHDAMSRGEATDAEGDREMIRAEESRCRPYAKTQAS